MQGLANWWAAEAPSSFRTDGQPRTPCGTDKYQGNSGEYLANFEVLNNAAQSNGSANIYLYASSPCTFPTIASYETTRSLTLLRRSSSSPSPTTSECYEKGQPLTLLHPRFRSIHP